MLALDYRWSMEQQFQTTREWAEECFGKYGLPYAIALHAPDPDAVRDEIKERYERRLKEIFE